MAEIEIEIINLEGPQDGSQHPRSPTTKNPEGPQDIKSLAFKNPGGPHEIGSPAFKDPRGPQGITSATSKNQAEPKDSITATPQINKGEAEVQHRQPALPKKLRFSKVKSSPQKPEKPKYTSIIAEAEAYFTKAKSQLGSARNLKTEIRLDVTDAVDGLYEVVNRLIKQAEAEGRNVDKPQVEDRSDRVDREPLATPLLQNTQHTNEESIILKRIEEQNILIKENTQKIESLKEAIEQKTLEGTMTYASVAAGPAFKKPQTQTALHSLVITSKNDKDTGEQVLSKLRDAINAKDGGLTVDKVRKARDRKVIVGCRTEEERTKIKERLSKVDNHLHFEDIKNRDPLLLLRDVFQYNTDEDVLKAIRNQNAKLFKDLEEQEIRVELKYRKKTRSPQTCHIVLRVSPKIWERAISIGSIHVDLQKIKVADQSPLIQCSLCLGYGHSKRLCKQTIEKCSHCGGPHMRAECTDWINGAAPSCCNCKHANFERTDHNAFSNECAVRQRWDALSRATIQYC